MLLDLTLTLVTESVGLLLVMAFREKVPGVVKHHCNDSEQRLEGDQVVKNSFFHNASSTELKFVSNG